MTDLRVTILGCGSSGGVPRIGGHWGACDPNEPKNTRRRCSMMVERVTDQGTTRVLIDTTPDMRQQLLDAGVGELDAVLWTHAHADHVHGIDDLRSVVNDNLARRASSPWATEEQFSLFRRYLDARHADGGQRHREQPQGGQQRPWHQGRETQAAAHRPSLRRMAGRCT